MSSWLKVLQDRQAALKADMRGISEKAKSENRKSLSDSERKDFDKNEAELKEVEADLARELRLQEREKTLQPVPDANVDAAKNAAALASNKATELDLSRQPKPKQFKGPDAKKLAFRTGMFYLAYLFKSDEARDWCEENGLGRKSLRSLSQSANAREKGGIFVPDELASTIIELRDDFGVFRNECTIWPMGSGSMTIPRSDSGIEAFFVGDDEGITESEKKWGEVTLQAKKIGALLRYPTELDEDAVINIADMLTLEIAKAFAYKEDLCGFLGNGSKAHGGILGAITQLNDGSHTAGVVEAAAGNTSFGELDDKDFDKVIGRLPQYAASGAKWYISRTGWAESMQRLLTALGGTTMTEGARGAGLMFKGYPVVLSPVLNSVSTAQVSTPLLLFGNLSMGAAMGTRRGMTLKSSDQRYFEKDVIAIKGTQRFDINVFGVGTNATAGPLVMLKTPGE